MKLRKIVFAVITTIAFGVALNVSAKNVNASPNWHKVHWVTITKDRTVIRKRRVIPICDSYNSGVYVLKKGAHIKLSHPGINFNWIIMSGRFKPTNKYTYVVDSGYENKSWFRMGIHKLPNIKPFHGYKIEAVRTLYTFNTFYDRETHDSISDYRPTQKSKIIFEYGSHVYPTHHEWAWVRGNHVTYYRYKNGSWYKTGKFSTSD